MREFLSQVNKEYIEAHPEKRNELSKRATRTLKRLWQDPTYRRLMHGKIIKGNKNRTTNKTGKSKFDSICARVLTEGEDLSERAYEQARKRVYPYGSATQWRDRLVKILLGEC